MVGLLLMLTAGSAFAQTDRKEVRKGNRLFKDENYKEAEVEYRKALIKDSLSIAGNYNLANTLMLQDDAANAELIYAKVGDTISKMPQQVDWKKGAVKVAKNDVAPGYYHNLGNSLLAQKRYGEAVDAYKNALRRNPSDAQTRENYIYAKKKMEDQQNQDQQQQQNQDQQNQQDQQQQQDQNQNQDQNKDQNKDQNQDNKDNKDNPDKKDQPQDQQQQPQNEPKITPQAAEQMLQAMQEKENQTQEKVKEEKAKLLKSKQKEKNW